jgi:hypothetical protein
MTAQFIVSLLLEGWTDFEGTKSIAKIIMQELPDYLANESCAQFIVSLLLEGPVLENDEENLPVPYQQQGLARLGSKRWMPVNVSNVRQVADDMSIDPRYIPIAAQSPVKSLGSTGALVPYGARPDTGKRVWALWVNDRFEVLLSVDEDGVVEPVVGPENGRVASQFIGDVLSLVRKKNWRLSETVYYHLGLKELPAARPTQRTPELRREYIKKEYLPVNQAHLDKLLDRLHRAASREERENLRHAVDLIVKDMRRKAATTGHEGEEFVKALDKLKTPEERIAYIRSLRVPKD